jgi:uncharacterized membrane protein
MIKTWNIIKKNSNPLSDNEKTESNQWQSLTIKWQSKIQLFTPWFMLNNITIYLLFLLSIVKAIETILKTSKNQFDK